MNIVAEIKHVKIYLPDIGHNNVTVPKIYCYKLENHTGENRIEAVAN